MCTPHPVSKWDSNDKQRPTMHAVTINHDVYPFICRDDNENPSKTKAGQYLGMYVKIGSESVVLCSQAAAMDIETRE